MMERNLEKSLDHLGLDEGGYSNRAADKGGPTNMGITLSTLRSTVHPGATVADLKALTKAQARLIYKRNYWDAVHASELPDGLDYSLFDEAVTSGPERAIKRLQTLVNVAVDGKIGMQTLTAAKNANLVGLITSYNNDRLSFLKSIPGPQGFKGNPGWEPRVLSVKAIALQMAAQPPVTTEPVVITRTVSEPVPVAPPAASKVGGAVGIPLTGIGIGGVVTSLGDFVHGLDATVQWGGLALIAVCMIAIWLERAKLASTVKLMLGQN